MTDAAREAAAPRVGALTGLRFIAALSVFFAHALPQFLPRQGAAPLWYFLVNNASGIGMPLFFVLSGFVIHYNYQDAIERGDFRRFYLARFARLYPLYLFIMVVELVREYGLSQLPGSLGVLLPVYLSLTQAWWYLILHGRTLIFQFGPALQIAWSISSEWFFYILYPVICLVLLRRAGRKYCLWLGLCLIVLSTVMQRIAIGASPAIDAFAAAHWGAVGDEQEAFSNWLTYFFPPAQVPAFLAGCLAAAIHRADRERLPARRERRLAPWLAGGSLALVVLIYCVQYGLLWVPLPYPSVVTLCSANTLLIPAMAALIFCCARYRTRTSKLLGAAWLVRCGEASYSLYLLHPLLIPVFKTLAARVAGEGAAAAAALLAMATVSAVAASLVSYALIERPGRRFVLRRLDRARLSRHEA